MKYAWLFVILFVACNSPAENEEEAVEEEATPLSADEIYAWDIQADSMRVVKNPDLPENYYQVDSLIKGMNSRWQEIQILKVKQSNDTLYLRIPEAEYLTQRMGSSGPEMYFAALYYNLTSAPGIRFVNVDLEEGDHAGPGVYGPNDFKDYKVVNADSTSRGAQ